jgi:hypothetical protein
MVVIMRFDHPPEILSAPKTGQEALTNFRDLLVWWIHHGMQEDVARNVMQVIDFAAIKES